MLRLPVLLLLALLSATSHALTLDSTPVPGGIAVITLPAGADPATARYRDRKILVTRNDDSYIAVIGLPLATKSGRHYLKVANKQGQTQSIGFQVEDKAYEEQHITIKDKRKVNPEKRDMERITRESKQANFYKECQDHPNMLKMVALSGGYSRAEANRRLSENSGMIASFSRALTEGLSAQQTDDEFNSMLDSSIQAIYESFQCCRNVWLYFECKACT